MYLRIISRVLPQAPIRLGTGLLKVVLSLIFGFSSRCLSYKPGKRRLWGVEISPLNLDLHLDTSYHDSIQKDTTSSGKAIAVYRVSAI